MTRIVAVLILLCSRAAYAQRCAAPADDQAIRRIAAEWKEGYNGGDAAKVAALYDENAYYLTQHFATGIVHGRSRIQAYVQRGVDARYRVERIEVLVTACSGDFGYTIARYESDNAGRKDFGVNLVVLRKTGGRWRIVAHESAVPDPALDPAGRR
ncbi:MAG: DUF4440 domain-containing protein [Bryobacteraceae bacterium]